MRRLAITLGTFVGLWLWPAPALGQQQVIFVSTGPDSGLRMYYPGSNDWWLDPSKGRLDVRGNGATAPLLSLLANGALGIGTTSPNAAVDIAGVNAVLISSGIAAVPGSAGLFISTSVFIGSGVLAASTVTAANITVTGNLTVPNGANPTDAAAFGQIYYGFQPAVQVTNATQFQTASSSYQDTPLTASITPTSASHRIKITVSGVMSINSNNAVARVTIKRGSSTNLGASGFASSYLATASAVGTLVTPVSIIYIDSPATTSSTAYTVQILCSSAVAEWNPGNQTSVIILEEIK